MWFNKPHDIQYVGSKEWGEDKKLIKMLYIGLISILDFECIAYESSSETQFLKKA